MMEESDSLVPLADVESIVGLKKTTLYKMIHGRTFPSPIKIGAAARWSRREVSAWIEAQKAAARATAG